MSSRKEQKERARQQRLAREAELAAARRRRRLIMGVGGAAAAVIAVIAAIAIASSGGSSHPGAGATAGLSAAAAPWAPEFNDLATRLQALNLPAQSDAAYHVHAELRVYVDGRQLPVPAQIGIDPQGQLLAPLHTHDGTGVIHIEAAQTYPFTLGQFFTIWGVKFTSTQLGGYFSGSGKVLAAYVNGKPVANPPAYVMQPHDLIAVGYGKAGSFPTSYRFTFPAGE